MQPFINLSNVPCPQFITICFSAKTKVIPSLPFLSKLFPGCLSQGNHFFGRANEISDNTDRCKKKKQRLYSTNRIIVALSFLSGKILIVSK
jgi:hypothetical protein